LQFFKLKEKNKSHLAENFVILYRKLFAMQYEVLFKQIMFELSNFENGPVADSLKNLGQPEAKIYGCTVADIKRIALKYRPSADFVVYLWRQNVREAKLAAIYLIGTLPEYLEVLGRIKNELNTGEQAEQLGFEVLGKMPKALDIAETMYESDNFFCIQAGFITAARSIQLNDGSYSELETILTKAKNYFETSHVPLRNSVSRVLRVIASTGEYGWVQVNKLIQQYKKTENESAKWIYNDVLITLEFIKPS